MIITPITWHRLSPRVWTATPFEDLTLTILAQPRGFVFKGQAYPRLTDAFAAAQSRLQRQIEAMCVATPNQLQRAA